MERYAGIGVPGLSDYRFANVGGISPLFFLCGVSTFRNISISPSNRYRLGKKTIK